MASVVHTLFSTELSIIPTTLENSLGNNFNNELCNAVTWLFVVILLAHFCLDRLLNVFLKQLGFAQYLRMRLSSSLWLLTSFVAFSVYYFITINEYNMDDLDGFKRALITQSEVVPTRKVLFHVLMCSFYLHMGYTQGVQLGSLHAFSKFFLLTVACTAAYILKLVEIPLALTAVIALSGIPEELTKMAYSLLSKENKLCNYFIRGIFIFSLLFFCIVYFMIIPLTFLNPLGTMLFTGSSDIILLILFTSLLCWLNLVIYKSILLNLIFHWLYHKEEKGEEKEQEEGNEKQKIMLGCLGNIIECSLFPPRTDDGYMIAYFRAEAKKREKRMIAKRKPKNRSMLLQTLKCMMAIKRKLSENRARSLDDFDDSDEKEDTSNIYSDRSEEEDCTRMKSSEEILKFSQESTHEEVEENIDDDAVEIEIKTISEEKLVDKVASKDISLKSHKLNELQDIEAEIAQKDSKAQSGLGQVGEAVSSGNRQSSGTHVIEGCRAKNVVFSNNVTVYPSDSEHATGNGAASTNEEYNFSETDENDDIENITELTKSGADEEDEEILIKITKFEAPSNNLDEGNTN